MKIGDRDGHAFVGNYQKVGHLEQNVFTVLKPTRKQATYRYDPGTEMLSPVPENSEGVEETVSYYQTASDMYREGAYLEVSAAESLAYRQVVDVVPAL
jgi:hypothetical protein